MTATHDTAAASRRLPSGPFPGAMAFQQLVRDALACAAREGWREIILCDPDFGDWPLGERAVAQSLQAWSATGRRCTLLARRYDEVVRRHARFVTWRTTWSHIVEAQGLPLRRPTGAAQCHLEPGLGACTGWTPSGRNGITRPRARAPPDAAEKTCRTGCRKARPRSRPAPWACEAAP